MITALGPVLNDTLDDYILHPNDKLFFIKVNALLKTTQPIAVVYPLRYCTCCCLCAATVDGFVLHRTGIVCRTVLLYY